MKELRSDIYFDLKEDDMAWRRLDYDDMRLYLAKDVCGLDDHTKWWGVRGNSSRNDKVFILII